jgi:AcrR family transcriptional regulator
MAPKPVRENLHLKPAKAVKTTVKATGRTVGRPKGSNSEDTKRRILDAARVCFAEAGFAATSNKEVAERTGVTPGSIYHHFDSKSDLFLTVHRELQQQSITACRETVRGKTTLLEAFQALLDQLLATQARMPSDIRFNAVVRIEAARNPEIRVAREDRAWRDLYAGMARLGVATGEVDPSNERAVRALLATLVLGTTQHAAEAAPAAHNEALRAVKLLLKGTLINPIE